MSTAPEWGEATRRLLDLLRSVAGGVVGGMTEGMAGGMAGGMAEGMAEGMAGGTAGHAPTSSPSAGESPESVAADCRWCPVCQLVAVVRGERPEITAALADVLTATADALHAFAAAPEDPPQARHRSPEQQPPYGDPPPVVQRIDIA